MVSWMTSVAGILAAVGLGLSQMDNPTIKLIGQIMSVVGTALLGLAAKQFNVTGGSVPQASPPGVANKSDALGVIAAVDAMTVKSFSEERAKATAEDVVATSVSPTAVNLNK